MQPDILPGVKESIEKKSLEIEYQYNSMFKKMEQILNNRLQKTDDMAIPLETVVFSSSEQKRFGVFVVVSSKQEKLDLPAVLFGYPTPFNVGPGLYMGLECRVIFNSMAQDPFWTGDMSFRDYQKKMNKYITRTKCFITGVPNQRDVEKKETREVKMGDFDKNIVSHLVETLDLLQTVFPEDTIVKIKWV